MRQEILQRLSDIESKYDVKILLAVESGSRAWGFESKDSDYDVRFIYVHRKDWYLSLIEGRDVIEELDPDGVFDLAGWDLYYHMAMNHDKRYLEKGGCELKRFMYHLRGLLAAKWAAIHDTYPPVLFNDLVEKMVQDDSIKAGIKHLVELKKESREHNTMIVEDSLIDYANRTAAEIESMFGSFPAEQQQDYRKLDEFFLNILNTFDI